MGGCRGRGTSSQHRLPAVPAVTALPPLHPLFAAQLFPESLLPPAAASRYPAALRDPMTPQRGCDPAPKRKPRGTSTPGLDPTCRLLSSTPRPASETEPPTPRGWPSSVLEGHKPGYTKSNGI